MSPWCQALCPRSGFAERTDAAKTTQQANRTRLAISVIVHSPPSSGPPGQVVSALAATHRTLRRSGKRSDQSATLIVARFDDTAPCSRLQIGKPKFMLAGIGL